MLVSAVTVYIFTQKCAWPQGHHTLATRSNRRHLAINWPVNKSAMNGETNFDVRFCFDLITLLLIHGYLVCFELVFISYMKVWRLFTDIFIHILYIDGQNEHIFSINVSRRKAESLTYTRQSTPKTKTSRNHSFWVKPVETTFSHLFHNTLLTRTCSIIRNRDQLRFVFTLTLQNDSHQADDALVNVQFYHTLWADWIKMTHLRCIMTTSTTYWPINTRHFLNLTLTLSYDVVIVKRFVIDSFISVSNLFGFY